MSLISKYTSQFKALMPQGAAWPREIATTLHNTWEAFAVEFAAIEERAWQFLTTEIDPRTTVEMLPDWERAYGLPEACNATPDTIAGRQKALHEKVTRVGGQSRQYYIDVAKRLGFDITITEPRPFVAGNRAGESAWGEDIRFTWVVVSPLTTITHFKAGSFAGEQLAQWGNEQLECVLSRLKPAHTTVIFSYV